MGRSNDSYIALKGSQGLSGAPGLPGTSGLPGLKGKEYFLCQCVFPAGSEFLAVQDSPGT